MDVPDFGSGLLLRPDRQAGLLPGRPAAGQGSRLGPPCSTKLSRHPGACGLVLSGTVEDQGGVAVQVAFSGQADRVVGGKRIAPMAILGSPGSSARCGHRAGPRARRRWRASISGMVMRRAPARSCCGPLRTGNGAGSGSQLVRGDGRDVSVSGRRAASPGSVRAAPRPGPTAPPSRGPSQEQRNPTPVDHHRQQHHQAGDREEPVGARHPANTGSSTRSSELRPRGPNRR